MYPVYPPYRLPPVMRIPMPNPIGGGDHPGPLIAKLQQSFGQPLYLDRLCLDFVFPGASGGGRDTVCTAP